MKNSNLILLGLAGVVVYFATRKKPDIVPVETLATGLEPGATITPSNPVFKPTVKVGAENSFSIFDVTPNGPIDTTFKIDLNQN